MYRLGFSNSQSLKEAPWRSNPICFFEGRCEEAVEFYRQKLGATVGILMRYQDSPEPACDKRPAGSERKIMHACLTLGDAVIMASDGTCSGTPDFKGFSLSLSVASESEADRMFDALADGGEVLMPLEKTFWSPRFGMLADRFGVSWMINTLGE
ncbi:MAG: VOC family protein [Gammaproteobacteria bacterium]|jgi:PhnB protein